MPELNVMESPKVAGFVDSSNTQMQTDAEQNKKKKK